MSVAVADLVAGAKTMENPTHHDNPLTPNNDVAGVIGEITIEAGNPDNLEDAEPFINAPMVRGLDFREGYGHGIVL